MCNSDSDADLEDVWGRDSDESSDEEDLYDCLIPPQAPGSVAPTKLTEQLVEIIRLVMESPLKIVVDRSTTQRRRFVKDKIRESLKVEPNIDPIRFMYIFSMEYCPTTTIVYINTMAYLFPKVRKAEGWKDHLRHFQLTAHRHQPFADQAKILSLEKLKGFEARGNIKISTVETIFFTWITASRYGDLKHMKWIPDAERTLPQHKLTVGLVDMRGSKGDKSGKRGDQKAVVFPQAWRDTIVRSCQRDKKSVTSEYLFKKALKTIDAEMTLHSCRRGAVQTLARLNYSKPAIQELTLHQQQHRLASSSADIYLNGLWLMDTREQNQINLQLQLLLHLGVISASTKQHVSQEWLKSIHSVAQDTL